MSAETGSLSIYYLYVMWEKKKKRVNFFLFLLNILFIYIYDVCYNPGEICIRRS